MISFNKYPVDIFICVLWSIILIPIGLLDVSGIIRIILGLPFLFFIPGYVLIFALFPTRNTNRIISIKTRIVLSFGFSIAVVPLIGFCLNYTPMGIRLETVLVSIFVFIIGVGAIAIYRWYNTSPDERLIISLDLSCINSENKLDKTLTIIIIISIILAVSISIYVMVTPKQEENFTSFFLFTENKTLEDYPRNLSIGEESNVIIGISNHEYETINYTVEVWQIQEEKNSSIIQNMWFIGKMSTILSHTELEIGDTSTIHWENNYSFSINRTGIFKLLFLLFKSPVEEYYADIDYVGIAEEKISSAYRETHLWINVN